VSNPFIVGVSGGSGSGKSTIVDMLREKFGEEGLLVLNMDHYYKDLSHLTTSQRDATNFDHPQALDMDLLVSHVSMLKAGQAIKRPTYDFATHTRSSEEVTLAPIGAIVIDGILSLYDERLRALYNLSVYVDVDADLRFIRRLRRDMAERGRSMDSVVEQYLDTVKPMHDRYVTPQKAMADVIISWKHKSENAVKMLASVLS
jgi:uridine kinase